MTRTFSFMAALTIVLLAMPRGAQSQVLLESGTRVRLAAPGLDSSERIGHIVSASQDSLSFRSDVRPFTRNFAVRDLTSIEVSGGNRTRRLRDAGYGLLIGGVAGAIAGAASYKAPPPDCWFFCETRSGDTAVGAILGGLVGTLAGGLIVGSFDRSERWVPLHSAHRFSVHPMAGGLALRMSL